MGSEANPQAERTPVIRVFLVDDHAVLRDGLRRVLEETADISVVGEAGTIAEALRRAAVERWDVLIADLTLPDGNGIDLVREARALQPRLAVLVLSMHAEDFYASRVLAAGASGYLTKGRPSSMVLEAVRRVASGQRFITPEMADVLLERSAAPDRPLHEALSDRQLQVLILVGQGKSPSEVGAALELRPSTVSSHLQQIKEKLALRNIGELAQYALRNGLCP